MAIKNAMIKNKNKNAQKLDFAFFDIDNIKTTKTTIVTSNNFEFGAIFEIGRLAKQYNINFLENI